MNYSHQKFKNKNPLLQQFHEKKSKKMLQIYLKDFSTYFN